MKGRFLRSALAAVAAFLIAAPAWATPSVKINKVLPHYPWDNLVDITYTLSDLRQSGDYGLAFIASTTDGSDITKWNANSKDVTSQVTVPPQTVNGTHTVTWTADTEIFSPAMDLTIKLYDYSATQPNYMVVDLLDPENLQYLDVEDPAYFNTEEYKTTKMAFRRIEPGLYWIGDAAYSSRHDIEVFADKAAYVGVFPVTEAQYAVLVEGMTNLPKPGDNMSWTGWRATALYPQVSITWNNFNSYFVNKLNTQNTRGGFQLTPESLWEVAARAGGDSSWGSVVESNVTDRAVARTLIDPYAWYSQNSGNTRHATGEKLPNAWGFYDMLGNVGEWCQDGWQGAYPWSTAAEYRNAVHDTYPSGSNGDKPVRGGYYGNDVWEMRCAYRYSAYYGYSYGHIGFRMAWIEP